MPSIRVNGKCLFYTIDGDSMARSTILFIHGLGSSSCFYHPIIPGLKSSAYCIAFDTPGSGQSELGGVEQTIATITEDAIALLDALKIEKKVIVVGHSLGSIVASHLAAVYSERVRGVVLLGPVNPDSAMAPVFEHRIQVARKDGLEPLARSIPMTATGDNAGSLQHAFIRTLILSTSAQGYISDCHAIATAEQPNYGAIDAPLLIIVGSDDFTVPLSASKTILEGYATKKSEKTIKDLSGVGHWHCVEAPAAVEELVKGFVHDMEQHISDV